MDRHFFLGANCGRGFFSFYEDFPRPEEGDFFWILKGGPGCGKSSFMKTVGLAAEKAGHDVDYIHCSADPESLDGVYITDLKLGYLDGTAPHALEAALPGAASMYLDLGAYYDSGALRGRMEEIAALNRRYKALYAEAYDRLFQAKELHDALEEIYNPHVDFDGVYALAKEHANRILG